jgi:mono/diheme cytochrome c family protein
MVRISHIAIVSCAVAWLATSVEAQRLGGDPKAAAVKNPVPATSASLKTGQRLYEKNCRQCHGTKGKGDGTLAPSNPKPADFTDDKWDHGSTDGEIYSVILNGAAPRPGQKESEMKAMKGTLSPTEIWQVVNYIRTLGPKPAASTAKK